MVCCKKFFSMFKILSVVMAVTIVLTGCTGKQGEQGEQGPQGVAGKDGQTPTIAINEEGYWVINGEVTDFKATGSDGKNGVNGKDGETPAITINEEGYWVINGEVTNVKATGNDGKNGVNGKDGETPTITINEEGYWVINGKVTEYKAVVDDESNDNDSSESEPIVMEGDGQTFHRLAPSALSFRSTAPLDEFQEVKVNGETVDPANYTLTEGSTIVTFNIDYLQSLGTDKHEVTVVSDSVSAIAEFEVIEPEKNEHGFYYNQPYTAYVSALGSNYALFFREDGTMDLIRLVSNYTETCSYTLSGNVVNASTSLGTINGIISTDGTEIYCQELASTAVLGDESIVADEDYIYIYDSSLGGYEVTAIDKTKSSYGAIKTGINGKPTVKLGYHMFYGNENMTNAPKIPDSVTEIGEDVFFMCSKLTSIEIPANVSSIGRQAFSTCWNLVSVSFEDGSQLTSIDHLVFSECVKLTTINFGGTVEQWNAISFASADWHENVPATEVKCSDGTVSLS